MDEEEFDDLVLLINGPHAGKNKPVEEVDDGLEVEVDGRLHVYEPPDWSEERHRYVSRYRGWKRKNGDVKP